MLVSLAITAIFLFVANAIVYPGLSKRKIRLLLVSISGLLLGCYCFVFVPIGGLTIAGMAIVGALCWLYQAPRRTFLIGSISVTAAVYVLFGFCVISDVLNWQLLKLQYPLQSITSRLAYEEHARPALKSNGAVSSTTRDHLDSLEYRFCEQALIFRNARRIRSLENLHAGVVKQFIASPGFGASRNLRAPSLQMLQLEQREQEKIPLQQPSQSYAPGDLTSVAVTPRAMPDFLPVHDENVLSFLNPRDFGYIQDRDHVVGFRPHQFHTGTYAPSAWQLERLELVSLLKYDEPVVYLSNNLPRMDELSTAATRPLNEFEKQALDKLVHGEELIVQETPHRLRMLGSLRALEQCVRCHHVERGELLGAFSYQLSAKNRRPSKQL